MNTKAVFIIVTIIILLGYVYTQNNQSEKQPLAVTPAEKESEVVARNLTIPWEAVFLSDDEILITERSGRLFLVKAGQRIAVGGVEHIGEGGLLGLAIDLNFSHNHCIYLYLTSRDDNGLTNKVERYVFDGSTLSQRTVILQGIAGSVNHNGGRIAFGPDGYLYITTGDAQNSSSAQNIHSLNGKILRVKDNGTIPSDNPFGNAVYSYGHRNAQGLAWDDEGRLWATEHGRSGMLSGFDELNLIEKGKNYGWPIIQGDQKQEGMVAPIIQSGSEVTWAPAGAAFYDGSIFFGGLRGGALFEYTIANQSLKKHFSAKFGRIRAVVVGPDRYLYMTTSNTDGRGEPAIGDDRLIKINLKVFI